MNPTTKTVLAAVGGAFVLLWAAAKLPGLIAVLALLFGAGWAGASIRRAVDGGREHLAHALIAPAALAGGVFLAGTAIGSHFFGLGGVSLVVMVGTFFVSGRPAAEGVEG